MTTVLVCGDRNWTDKEAIRRRLSRFPAGTVVIEGGCRGADRLAFEVATELRLTVVEYPADWAKHGRAAGPIRNRMMLDQKPNLVVAFHNDLLASRGTRDTVLEARRRGIDVEVISSKEKSSASI